MEDYSRDLEKELDKYSVPNPFKQSRNWQLMFISEDGKTVTIKKYKGLVISILVALSVAILFSLSLSVLYYQSAMEKRELKLSVEKTKRALSKVTEEKELLNARLFFEDKDKVITPPDNVAGKKATVKVKQSPKTIVKPAVEKMSVGVENLSMTKAENASVTKIRFLIRNLSKISRISGYVFVVLKPDSKRQGDWLTLPPVLLKNGEPAVAGKGRYFSINHFKSMNFKFKDTNPAGAYKSVTIFVFTKTGERVAALNFPVDVKIIKKPVVKTKTVAKIADTKKTTEVKKPVTAVKPPVTEASVAEKKSAVAKGSKKTERVKKVGNVKTEPAANSIPAVSIKEGVPENAD